MRFVDWIIAVLIIIAVVIGIVLDARYAIEHCTDGGFNFSFYEVLLFLL